MAIVAVEIRVGSREFQEAERRLSEWGRACRQTAQALGYPTASGISRMIEQVKVHEQLRKGVVRKPLKRSKLVKADREADAKAVSIEIRHADKEPTAGGRDTFSMRLDKVQFEASVAQVEEAVNRLSGEDQKIIRRCYLYGQPDRQAAQELRMPKEKLQDWRESLVIRIGEILAVRSRRAL